MMTIASSASSALLGDGTSVTGAPISGVPATETPTAATPAAETLTAETLTAEMLIAVTPAAETPAAGFTDTVRHSQQTFRSALQALAHPGSVHDINADCDAPAGLSQGMTAMLLTLADVDTPVWLPAEINDAVPYFLRFHCGCPLVSQPMQARFVVVPWGFPAPDLARCHSGDSVYPDTSTTLLLEVDALHANSQIKAPLTGAVDEHLQGALQPTDRSGADPDVEQVMLSGPGINGQRTFSVSGLPQGFWSQWRANHGLFPLGTDVFLIQGNRLCGLPRTVVAEG